MHFRHCLIKLGMIVFLLEGTIITSVQTEATFASPSLLSLEAFKFTTASRPVQTSARPTTLLRRIDVRRADYNVKPTTDIFQSSARRSMKRIGLFDDLWKWDYWCMLQPETGNCGNNKTKYYYNTQLNQCLPHLFSGCKTRNNRNQFGSIAECENHCRGSALMPVTIPAGTDICELQPITGRCLGRITMFYYDVNARECKTFLYGGCAGNDNRFEREMRCLLRCAKSKYASNDTLDYEVKMVNPELELQNITHPPQFPPFYYDVNARECKTFLYGGCAGNDNRFEREMRCLLRCAKSKYASNDTLDYEVKMVNPELELQNITHPPQFPP